jgi:hypothetical protein
MYVQHIQICHTESAETIIFHTAPNVRDIEYNVSPVIVTENKVLNIYVVSITQLEV